MLVSKSKNFLFIHIPKTAGTSINEILSNHAIPKNKNLIRKISSYFPVRENINKAYFRAHPKAVSVSKKIGQKEFDKFFKFSFIFIFDILIRSFEIYVLRISITYL